MPSGLRRFHESGQSHFLTFSCYHRQPKFASPKTYDLFVQTLEDMRVRFKMRVYGYVVLPEHVHLLVSEPEVGSLADAMHYLKLSFAKRMRTRAVAEFAQVSVQRTHANLGHPQSTNMGHPQVPPGSFWEKRYYDRNVRDADEFTIKLRYLHRNPVKRGLVKEPGEWKWSSFRHYALREIGVVEIESEWTARDRETRKSDGAPRVFLSPS